jgi:LAO/AO transport system kinase
MTTPLAEQLRQGNRRALARAITAVETGGQAARDLLAAVYAHAGRAHVIGVTGSPGAGKSTLVNALVLHWRSAGRTVGVVAVDPSSPFSGGAILGDRIRMQPLGGDPGVFVRSMASRGRLGGIARATGDAVTLLDAAGYEIELVETVGAGQSEVEIAGQAHTTIVVEAPGMGDDVQSIKAGILEIADIVVVNKADRPDANRTLRQLRAAMQLGELPAGGWRPPVLSVVATSGSGIVELAATVQAHLAHLRASGQFARREREHVARTLRAIVQERAIEQALEREGGAVWQEQVERVARREIDPYTAAALLMRAR